MKKVLIGVGVFFVVVLGALIAIPYFYSIDQFRPQIQAAIEKNIRGKVELGKLSLALFPNVRVGVDGVVVKAPAPYDKAPLAKVGAVELQMPLSALLVAPSARLVVKDVELRMITQGEKSNLAATLPDPAVAAAAPAQPAAGAPPVALGDTLKGLPPWLSSRAMAARFAFDLENADIAVQDLAAPKGNKTELKKLNFSLENVGLATPMEIRMSADVDVISGAIVVKGPISTDGKVIFKPVGKDSDITIDVEEKLDGLDIAMKPLFHKASGLAFSAGVQAHVVQSPQSITADLSKITFKFANVSTQGSVKVKTDAVDPTRGEMSAGFKVANFELAPFGSLVPMVRDFKLGGKVNVDIKAQGPLKDPAIDVLVTMKDVTGATPELQKPITDLGGTIRVSGKAANPKVAIESFAMKIGSSDVAVDMKTEGLEQMAMNLAVKSKNFNADELLGLKPLVIDTNAKAAPVDKSKLPPPMPLDDSLNAMSPVVEEQLKNPMIDKIKANMVFDFKMIHAMGAELSNVTFNAAFANRKLAISKTGLNGYGGRVTMDMDLDLTNPMAMGYRMNSVLSGVEVQAMTKVHAPGWKDEITGILDGEFKISGAGLKKDQLASSLAGGLKGSLKNGRISLPIVKIVGDVIDKIPAVGGKKIELPKKEQNRTFNGEFKTCRLDTSIKGRMVTVNDLDVNYDTLNTRVGDMEFKSKGTVSFDRKIDIEGTAILGADLHMDALKGPNGKVDIPLKMAGSMDDPKPDYGYSVKVLAERVAKYEIKTKGAALQQKAVSAIMQKAPEPVKKALDKAPPDLKKQLKKFGF